MADDPIEIASITPYGEPGRAPVRRPARQAALVGLGWLVVAALAILASFARVYSVSTLNAPDANGATAGFLLSAVDGWGRLSITPSEAGFEPSGAIGPRYGVLFCIAAGAVLLGWLLSLRAKSARWQPGGRAISGAGCVFLLGVLACQVVATLPYRRDLFRYDAVFHFGPSPWIAGGACALGLSTWAAQYWLERGLVAADSAPDRTATAADWASTSDHSQQDRGI